MSIPPTKMWRSDLRVVGPLAAVVLLAVAAVLVLVYASWKTVAARRVTALERSQRRALATQVKELSQAVDEGVERLKQAVERQERELTERSTPTYVVPTDAGNRPPPDYTPTASSNLQITVSGLHNDVWIQATSESGHQGYFAVSGQGQSHYFRIGPGTRCQLVYSGLGNRIHISTAIFARVAITGSGLNNRVIEE